jgi:hypothetical protein
MKTIKLLILVAAAFLLIGCTPDETDCNCTAEMRTAESTNTYYFSNFPIDCETGQPLTNREGHYFMRCVD